MKKEELKIGNIIETRYGGRFLKSNDEKYYALNGRGNFDLNNSTETLESLMTERNDIIKVYEDYTCSKLLWERQKSLLTQEEKDYLKAVLKPITCKVERVYKIGETACHLSIIMDNEGDCIILPNIHNMTLKFEGIKQDKSYTLKELGLEDLK